MIDEKRDLGAAMDRPAIPEQVDGATQMAKQVPEKRADVETTEVPRATPEIERHPPSLRRHRQPTADRQPIMAVPVPDAGCLSSGRPGPVDIRDE